MKSLQRKRAAGIQSVSPSLVFPRSASAGLDRGTSSPHRAHPQLLARRLEDVLFALVSIFFFFAPGSMCNISSWFDEAMSHTDR